MLGQTVPQTQINQSINVKYLGKEEVDENHKHESSNPGL